MIAILDIRGFILRGNQEAYIVVRREHPTGQCQQNQGSDH